ncbi:LytTR family transcriptional regulator DNA-binding domain-containing protein [Rheinheimera baltica]|uniref:LytTR family transcriptional regulator DNA-binding domain-containing protein n=1 Tax=Rheinheimera baltica TaxID=67576 RepID=A0ABT9HV50_9GAMM|nr:LytTR family transcriptional regulator DNA-binding domain-containing protein [Rheinheimera baltica]MDP5135008.1 LytTR family transcriptional regulator DNA-binding domain-containing protein [Rheinheimera baltica]
MTTAMIVEDSRLARVELKNLLLQHHDITLLGEYEEPDMAIQAIEQQQPEVLFLDIQLPGKNGFELLDALSYQPAVIFTTAYDHYAVRSFEYDALDYLLKPIEPARLAQALQRVQHRRDNTAPANSKLEANSSVFVKDGEQCWMLELSRVVHFTSVGNYTEVHFDGHRPLIHKSLNQLEARLPEQLFFRANRQQIINIKKIASIDLTIAGNLELVLCDASNVEVSRRHSARFKQLLSL